MFLNELNKKEALTFINLVKLLSNVDADFSKKEEELIGEYIEELSLQNDTIETLTLETAIAELNNSTIRVKNIIYFELVGLALADSVYSDKEIDFLNIVANSFNIDSKKQQAFVNYFKEVKDLYDVTVIDCESRIEALKQKALDLLD
ncbi:MAG: hypothetical protein Q8936_09900 [Bacillota bacterium]|nr:hypothetical protein [Bacillota bacterium]